MVAVGGTARDKRPLGADEEPVNDGTHEPIDTLTEPEGLGWASLGSWTDIAIKSSPRDILKQTIGALQHAVEEEAAEQRRADKERNVQLAVIGIAGLILLVLTVILLSVSLSDKTKSASWALLATAIATMGFTAGWTLTSKQVARRGKQDIRLYQAALHHEAEYRQQIVTQDEHA
jgi:uncharacterized membrane protein YhaH (DUF805 family)